MSSSASSSARRRKWTLHEIDDGWLKTLESQQLLVTAGLASNAKHRRRLVVEAEGEYVYEKGHTYFSDTIHHINDSNQKHKSTLPVISWISVKARNSFLLYSGFFEQLRQHDPVPDLITTFNTLEENRVKIMATLRVFSDLYASNRMAHQNAPAATHATQESPFGFSNVIVILEQLAYHLEEMTTVLLRSIGEVLLAEKNSLVDSGHKRCSICEEFGTQDELVARQGVFQSIDEAMDVAFEDLRMWESTRAMIGDPDAGKALATALDILNMRRIPLRGDRRGG